MKKVMIQECGEFEISCQYILDLLNIAVLGICIVVSSLIMTYYKIDDVPWNGDKSFYLLNFIAI